MKISILFFTVIAVVISSCTQSQKKNDPTVSSQQNNMLVAQQIKISVDGMTCSACQSTVKKTIKSLDGVKEAEVSLENKNAFITYYPNLIKPEQIMKAVNDKGFTAGNPQEVKQ
jgi:copper chaperone CopZ